MYQNRRDTLTIKQTFKNEKKILTMQRMSSDQQGIKLETNNKKIARKIPKSFGR